MAVLHAAGVSDGSKSLIFAGDSGAGKSTLAALLMSRGFEVLADDFLPVESRTGRICSFPAAISVKKKLFICSSPTIRSWLEQRNTATLGWVRPFVTFL